MKKMLPVFLVSALLFCGCLATTYYSGRTLSKNEEVGYGGIDNFVIYNRKTGRTVDMEVPFLPTIGISRGLGNRFETGFRFSAPIIVEGLLRWQVTPRDWPGPALSVNVHAGAIPFDFIYFRYGFTVSRRLGSFEPYFNYSRISTPELLKDYRNALHTTALGIMLPLKRGYLVPEVNFYEGYLTLNLGLRVTMDRKHQSEKR